MKILQINIWLVWIACWIQLVEGQCNNNGTSDICTSPGFYNLANVTQTYWSFHPNNPALDYSGNGMNLTVPASHLAPTTNCTSATEGPGGNWASGCAWSDGGTRDVTNTRFYQMPNMVLPTAVSICLWYRPDSSSTASWTRIFSLGEGTLFRSIELARPAGSTVVTFYWSQLGGGSPIYNQINLNVNAQAAVWTHFCMTVASGVTSGGALYANGIFITGSTFTPLDISLGNTKNQNFLFAESGGTSSIFAGSMDDFRIFNRVLSATEVSAVYNYRGLGLTANIWINCSNTCNASQTKQCNKNGVTVCVNPGSWFDGYNSSSITGNICPAGTYDSLGGLGTFVSSCVPCAIGAFQNQAGQTSCILCPAGSISASAGQSVCTACAYGFSSAAGASSCFLLPGVMRITTQGGPALLSACPAGMYTPGVNVTALTVASSGCSIGEYYIWYTFYSYDGIINNNDKLVHSNTPSAGVTPYFWYDLGSVQLIQTVVFWDRQTLCSRENGFRLWVGNTSDSFNGTGNVQCYQDSMTLSSDSTCFQRFPLSFQCNVVGRYAFFVARGTTTITLVELAFLNNSCTPCPAGTFSTFDNTRFVSVCTPCDTGFFQSQPGQTSCSACPTGLIAANVGSSACVSTVGLYNLANFTHTYYSFHPNNPALDYSGNGRTLIVPAGKLAPTTSCTSASQGPGGNWASNCAWSDGGTRDVNNTRFYQIPALYVPPALSICLWFRPDSDSSVNWDRIYAIGERTWINTIEFLRRQSSPPNRMQFCWNKVTFGNPFYHPFIQTLAANIWHHVCFAGTIGSTDGTLYLDGVNVTALPILVDLNFAAVQNNNWLFTGQGSADTIFQGSMDEFRIYNRTLSALEVSAVYNYRGSGLTSNLWVSCANSCSVSQIKHCNNQGVTVCVSPGYWYAGYTSSQIWPNACPENTYDSLNGTGTNSSVCISCPTGLVSDVGSAACFDPLGWYNLGDSTYTYYSFHPSNPLLDNSGNGRNLSVPSGKTQPSTTCTNTSQGPGGNWNSFCAYSPGATARSNANTAYYQMPSITFSSNISVCWWFRPDLSTPYFWDYVFSLGNGFRTTSIEFFRVSASSRMVLEWSYSSSAANRSALDSGVTAAANVWVHTCVTANMEMKQGLLYTNGGNSATAFTAFDLDVAVAKTNNILFGSSIAGEPVVQGSIEDFRIYNRVLTPTGINAVYNYRGAGLSSTIWVSCNNTCTTSQTKQCNKNGITICVSPGYWFEGYTSNATSTNPCPTSTYDSRNGTGRNSSACVACPIGWSSPLASTYCTPCPVGFYRDSSKTTCISCSPNTFQNQTGQSTCMTCPGDWFSDYQSSTCFNPDGWYNLGDSTHTYYSFHPNNILADYSGNGRTLTIPSDGISPTAGCTLDINGPGGSWASYCAMSNGGYRNWLNSSFLQMPSMTLPSAFTIAFWWSPQLSTAVGNERIFTIGEGDSLKSIEFTRVNSTTQIFWYGTTSNVSFPITSINTTINDTRPWFHICLIVRNGIVNGTSNVYVNSVLIPELTFIAPDMSFSNPKTSNFLFTSASPTAPVFQGRIDDFRIYNRTLTQTGINAVYNYRGPGLSATIWVSCNNTCTSSQYKRCNQNGITVCVSPGFWFDERTISTTPTPCAIGTYDVMQGLGESAETACIACPDGLYTDAIAMASCQSCFI